MEINSCSVNSTAYNAAEIIVHFTVLPLGRTEYSFVSRFLSPSSDSTSEDKGGFQDQPGVSHLQPDRPTSSGQASSSSISTGASDGFQSGSG
jgi:hypothetical protein